jgi:hypothetical protein
MQDEGDLTFSNLDVTYNDLQLYRGSGTGILRGPGGEITSDPGFQMKFAHSLPCYQITSAKTSSFSTGSEFREQRASLPHNRKE